MSTAVSPNPQYTGEVNTIWQELWMCSFRDTVYCMYNLLYLLYMGFNFNLTSRISWGLVECQPQDTFRCLVTLAKFSETARVRFWSSNLISRLNLRKAHDTGFISSIDQLKAYEKKKKRGEDLYSSTLKEIKVKCTYLGSRVIFWISLTAELAAYKAIFPTCMFDDKTRKVPFCSER